MHPLTQWANRHGIPAAALADLYQLLGMGAPAPPSPVAGLRAEAEVLQVVRLEAARRGMRLWRNNNGATQDETGRMIRFGLANDSPAVSRVMKSSDLIGVTPVVCQCGVKHGIFTAVECKKPGWRYTGTEREVAQANFINLVVSMGGIAYFSTGELL